MSNQGSPQMLATHTYAYHFLGNLITDPKRLILGSSFEIDEQTIDRHYFVLRNSEIHDLSCGASIDHPSERES